MRPIATFLDNERVIVDTRSYSMRAIVLGHVYTPDNQLRYVVAYQFDRGYAYHIYPASCLRTDRNAPSDASVSNFMGSVSPTAEAD